MATDLHTILTQRKAQYGSFDNVAEHTQFFMSAFEKRQPLPPVLAEALHMICNKLARIACGDPLYEDSWRDIAGYAMLATRWLEDYNGQVEKRLPS